MSGLECRGRDFFPGSHFKDIMICSIKLYYASPQLIAISIHCPSYIFSLGLHSEGRLIACSNQRGGDGYYGRAEPQRERYTNHLNIFHQSLIALYTYFATCWCCRRIMQCWAPGTIIATEILICVFISRLWYNLSRIICGTWSRIEGVKHKTKLSPESLLFCWTMSPDWDHAKDLLSGELLALATAAHM